MKKLSLILIAVLLISLLCGTIAGAEATAVTVACGTKLVTLKGENTDGNIFVLLSDGSGDLTAVKALPVADSKVDFGGKTGTVSFIWLDADLRPVKFEKSVAEGPITGPDELGIA